MKIKKYTADSEKNAILKVKEELGKDALIVSVKNIKPKGLYKIFKKPYVEVTAALDAKEKTSDSAVVYNHSSYEQVHDKNESHTIAQSFQSFFPKDNSFEKQVKKQFANIHYEDEHLDSSTDHDSQEPFLKAVYEHLLDNDVKEEYVNKLTTGLGDLSYSNHDNIDELVSVVYKRVVNVLSDYEPIKLIKGKTKKVVFVGPTGVGKTTTIAKIASYFLLNLNKNVGLITADTYRIAAVEQLRTYANILNIPIKVVYGPEELEDAIQEFSDLDLVLIDTAGRSYKNKEHIKELENLLQVIPDKEVFLVLSITSKYRDMMKIAEVYSKICEYKLILTKLDETMSYGNIVNLKLNTKAKLSYVTFGQNVPEDISEINVHEIAKQILGGCDDGSS